MTNKRSTKHALLMSALALLLCVSMLIGSTYAWFTDSVTSTGNIIKSGTLDVTMEWKDATENGAYKNADDGDPIFNYDMWEPGYVEAKNIKIANVGTLALKYQLNILAETAVSELADVIDVYYADGEKALANRDLTAQGLTRLGTLTEVLAGISTTASGNLKAGENHTVTLALKMQESADNKYQDKSIGSTFTVQLLATQLMSEDDSFDDQYDKYASVACLDAMKEALADGHTEFNFMGNTINLDRGLTKAMVPAGTTITISNANVNGRSYGNGVDGTVIFENCTFTNTGAYSIHFDNGAGNVIFKNCTLYGWNSFGSSLNSVSFYDSALYGNGMYALIRSYVNLYLENCTYDISKADHTDEFSEGIEAVNGAQLEMVNCSQVLASAEAFIGATKGGNVSITEDIVYNNTDPQKQMIMESDAAINFEGNGNTITTEGADPSIGNHGYVAFVPPAGENVTVSDLTVTGTGFVEVGHYGIGGGQYVLNNVKIENLASTLANGDKGFTLGCAFMGMGDVTLNNCVMTGTTSVVEGSMAVDLGCGQAWSGYTDGNDNKISTTINGGEYGTIYCWSQSIVTVNGAKIDTLRVSPINGNVTVKSGTKVEKLIVDYGTSAGNVNQARLQKLVIEEGATVGEIVYADNTYTVATWNTFVAAFGA